MNLNRILNNQLHLHDEGNPAWGMSGGPKGDQEEKDIARLAACYETAPKNFAEELKSLTKEYVSPKLEGVKDVLRSAATKGTKEVTLSPNQIDDYVIQWLKDEGITVEDNWSGTRDHGSKYYKISW